MKPHNFISAVPNLPAHMLISNKAIADIIGRRLESFRKQRGLSRYKLAMLTGLAEDTIRKYEQGKRTPCARFWIALAQTLPEMLDELLGIRRHRAEGDAQSDRIPLRCSLCAIQDLFALRDAYRHNEGNWNSNRQPPERQRPKQKNR
jgi:transcriptional regulator with XRE-family HTH domain